MRIRDSAMRSSVTDCSPIGRPKAMRVFTRLPIFSSARSATPLIRRAGLITPWPLPQQQVLRRDAHVLEIDFHVAVGRIIETKYRQVPQDGDPGGVARHENHRLLAVLRRARVGLAHEYEQPAARTAPAGGPPHAPVGEVRGASGEDGTLSCGV